LLGALVELEDDLMYFGGAQWQGVAVSGNLRDRNRSLAAVVPFVALRHACDTFTVHVRG
jgi:hypothetical protein